MLPQSSPDIVLTWSISRLALSCSSLYITFSALQLVARPHLPNCLPPARFFSTMLVQVCMLATHAVLGPAGVNTMFCSTSQWHMALAHALWTTSQFTRANTTFVCDAYRKNVEELPISSHTQPSSCSLGPCGGRTDYAQGATPKSKKGLRKVSCGPARAS